MLSVLIHKLMNNVSLTSNEIGQAMDALLSDENVAQQAALVTLLTTQGFNEETLYYIVKYLRKKMITVHCDFPVLDIVGTGGDGMNTLNLSTGAALLAASCGVKVVKHGNRKVSSQCGSADVLEALGVNLEQSPEAIKRSLMKSNFGYCYAPFYHQSFSRLKNLRSQLKVPTIFNAIGPLLNPANAQYLMIGVANREYLKQLAGVARRLGIKRAVFFHCAGLDEACCLDRIEMIELNQETLIERRLDPLDYAFEKCSLSDLQGQDKAYNASQIINALNGKQSPFAENLILNAGMACALYGVTPTLEEGFALARRNQESGAALRVLTQLQQINKQSNFLDQILQTKKREITPLKKSYGDHLNLNQIKRPTRCFKQALSQPHFSVIAEIKRQSPSRGALASIPDPEVLLDNYLQGGASAISVLTDKEYFGGSLTDLIRIDSALKQRTTPVLRKDFIIDESQVIESVIAGADAILLIVAVLKEKTSLLYQFAKKLGLDVLVEVHTADELQTALAFGADIIGVNNRNLKTFETDINHCLRLKPQIPSHVITVAESGVRHMDDLHRIKQAGFDAVLIGEMLVQSTCPSKIMQQIDRECSEIMDEQPLGMRGERCL